MYNFHDEFYLANRRSLSNMLFCIMQFPSDIVVFHLFCDGSVDMQIWTPLTRKQCRVSDTQVTVKALGPRFFFFISGWSLEAFWLSPLSTFNTTVLCHSMCVMIKIPHCSQAPRAFDWPKYCKLSPKILLLDWNNILQQILYNFQSI